ncbi:hypothetical protein MR772_04835, partial [bacterium]|nr:hypothetical protein [bacterium]
SRCLSTAEGQPPVYRAGELIAAASPGDIRPCQKNSAGRALVGVRFFAGDSRFWILPFDFFFLFPY